VLFNQLTLGYIKSGKWAAKSGGWYVPL